MLSVYIVESLAAQLADVKHDLCLGWKVSSACGHYLAANEHNVH